MLHNKIVFYADDVYMDVVPSGRELPTTSEIRIPIDLFREKRFQFGVGQMPDIASDLDFEPLLNVEIDDFPETQDGNLMLVVSIAISEAPRMDVEVVFTTPNNGDQIIGQARRYTGIPLN